MWLLRRREGEAELDERDSMPMKGCVLVFQPIVRKTKQDEKSHLTYNESRQRIHVPSSIGMQNGDAGRGERTRNKKEKP